MASVQWITMETIPKQYPLNLTREKQNNYCIMGMIAVSRYIRGRCAPQTPRTLLV